MERIKQKVAWIYFIIHLLVELVCFALIYDKFGLGVTLLVAVVFDFFAFVPQAIIGQLNDWFHKLDIGTIGVLLMAISVFLLDVDKPGIYLTGIIALGLGNAFLHEAGAVATVVVSGGTLFPSALFVSGGSFGLIIGQLLGKYGINKYYLLIVLVVIEILVLYSNPIWLKKERKIPEFHLVNELRSEWVIVLVAFGVTTARSYVGYAIPISWNKTVWQSVLLFFIMGAGKAVGGYLSDKIGAKKTGVLSTIICIPFLLIGKDIMTISVIGVFLFSMTMSITFGMLLSVIKENPGLAFGVTTLGLFLGICPVLFFGKFGYLIDSILVVIMSLASAYGLYKTLR